MAACRPRDGRSSAREVIEAHLWLCRNTEDARVSKTLANMFPSPTTEPVDTSYRHTVMLQDLTPLCTYMLPAQERP